MLLFLDFHTADLPLGLDYQNRFLDNSNHYFPPIKMAIDSFPLVEDRSLSYNAYSFFYQKPYFSRMSKNIERWLFSHSKFTAREPAAFHLQSLNQRVYTVRKVSVTMIVFFTWCIGMPNSLNVSKSAISEVGLAFSNSQKHVPAELPIGFRASWNFNTCVYESTR